MITVYVSIGNSDDKLSQADWSEFWGRVHHRVGSAPKVHGMWTSQSTWRWQNACWCIEVRDDYVDTLKAELRKLAKEFRQDSIAWAPAQVEFLGPADD